MTVYYGTVMNKQVILEGDVPLADGQRVEVRPATSREEEVWDRLRADGLLDVESLPILPSTHSSFTPILVRGQPLSEQIIAERR